jgi:SAM-dependent methyltransferase
MMRIESVHALDSETLEPSRSKGHEHGTTVSSEVNANSVKVRRVTLILRDFAGPVGEKLRVLDVACGEGVYAIEAALRGAEVLALDARIERMQHGARAAQRLGLVNVRFEQDDVRKVSAASRGQFDVILFLGILYHLCEYREHGDHDPDEVRRTRLLASLDNAVSFWFTKKSLVELLCAAGFTSDLECHAPLEALKPKDRVTLVAMKGTRVRISTYPWVNDKTDDEVEPALRAIEQSLSSKDVSHRGSIKERIRNGVNRLLRPLGCEIVRV